MSLLPQRKKSAEEIAKLRESLGILGQAAAEEDSSVVEPASAIKALVAIAEIAKETPAAKAPAPVPKPAPPVPDVPAPEPEKAEKKASPMHLAPLSAHRPVRSLKRSERDPIPVSDELKPPESAELPAPRQPKSVRSLRKSELVPLTVADIHTPPVDSKLPVHRHSDQELNELRRQSATNVQAAAEHFTKLAAHPALLIPGYLSAFGGAASFWYYEFSIGVTAACVVVALLIGSFIYLKKPLSLHHAAFISVIALFVIVFGALHYFPQLRHGT